MATVARQLVEDEPERDLFAAIGCFLRHHRLVPDPAHYAFAHKVLNDPQGAFARSVADITDSGMRITAREIATLSGAPNTTDDGDARSAANLVSRAEDQMRDFGMVVERLRAEASDFGRDLAASVSELTPLGQPDLVHLTATMLAQVQEAEHRIMTANEEAAALRTQLEAARGDARSDALTGLPNRRALVEDFAARIASGAPLCLAVCDIDHFKRINDRFGHSVGDRVLRAIASELAKTCGGAFVTRYGGEEFAVLFSGGDLAQATATLDRARAAVAAKNYRKRDDSTPLGAITFSAGVVTVAVEESFDDAFTRADTLLYAAKHEGRNQIRA
jgi:diguanylate cyclase